MYLVLILENRWSKLNRKVISDETSAQQVLEMEKSRIAIEAQGLDSCEFARFLLQFPKTVMLIHLQMKTTPRICKNNGEILMNLEKKCESNV